MYAMRTQFSINVNRLSTVHKSLSEDKEFSAKCRTPMSDGYNFFSVSTRWRKHVACALSNKDESCTKVVLVVAAKAPYCCYSRNDSLNVVHVMTLNVSNFSPIFSHLATGEMQIFHFLWDVYWKYEPTYWEKFKKIENDRCVDILLEPMTSTMLI